LGEDAESKNEREVGERSHQGRAAELSAIPALMSVSKGARLSSGKGLLFVDGILC
jgi:hypothetical protein